MRFVRRALRKLAQAFLMAVGRRVNYFLVHGIDSPPNRFDHRAFMRGTRWFVTTDVVRNATVELLSREIYARTVPGAVAEVGVYQGDFAAILNHHFPDRKLYLFDTFEGFRAWDVHLDRRRGFSDVPDDFSDTTVDLVKSKMRRAENVEIRRGWFPESAAGCEEERFCFVSLDVDLHEPTCAALRWFYPRLFPGGYLMVHDYNNAKYGGVREAVRRFSAVEGVPYFTLPDVGGSVVIAKPMPSDELTPEAAGHAAGTASTLAERPGEGLVARPPSGPAGPRS